MASGRGAPRLVIRSPQTGYVVEKKIVEGAAVEAKMTLFEVADLSTVWVEADVYEKDIPFSSLASKSKPRSRLIQIALHRETRVGLSPTGYGHSHQPGSL